MLQPTTYVSRLHGVYIPATDLRVPDPGYHIRCEKSDPPHEWGRGGEYERRTLLVKETEAETEVVLVSRQYVRYNTYSDDSEDHEVVKSSDTYLLQEDPVARRIFEEISRQAAERGLRTQALYEALEAKTPEMARAVQYRKQSWNRWLRDSRVSDAPRDLEALTHAKRLKSPCPKCGEPTIVCCHVDTGQGGPDHHDQFCHVCLNPACNFGEHQAHTVASSMVTATDQECWFCGRDVLAEG